jgi:hypothetical protein
VAPATRQRRAVPAALGQVPTDLRAADRECIDWFKALYPRWEDFLALRERRDPNNIFLTSYWRDRFRLWDAPAPMAQP